MLSSKNNQRGFTLIEVGIVVPILLLIVLGLVSSLYFAYTIYVTERVQAQSSYDISEGLSMIEKDVSLSSQFLSTNDATTTDAYLPASNGGTWSYLGESENVRALILRTYTSTTNPESNNRSPVFVNQLGCSADRVYYNDVLDYNTIYFVSQNNLYRRRIVNSTSPSLCQTAYQAQSCPSLETLGTPTRNAACASDDELIVKDVIDFRVTYYQNSASSTPLDTYTSGGDALLPSSNAIEVSITTGRKSMGSVTPVRSSILIPKLNASRTGATP